MRGMDAASGAALDGLAHLRQSIRDVLTTPIGSRVMRRSYGSRCARLLDQPVGPGWKARMRAGALDALARWEPRLRVDRLAVSADGDGGVTVEIEGVHLPGAAEARLAVAL